jgi:hypothetical protein
MLPDAEEKKLDESFDETSLEDNSLFESSQGSPPKHQSNRYSDRFEVLFKFLDAKSISNENDSVDTSLHKRINGSSTVPCSHGLVDITNYQSSHQETSERVDRQKETTIKGKLGNNNDCTITNHVTTTLSADEKAACNKAKRYIWDDWEETLDGQIVLLRDVQLDKPAGLVLQLSNTKMAAGEDKTEAMAATLKDLKAMSKEIQSRAATLKTELEAKKAEVEELHAIRIQNEAEHVKRMKSLKRQLKERSGEMKTKHDQASHTPYNVYLQCRPHPFSLLIKDCKGAKEGGIRAKHSN